MEKQKKQFLGMLLVLAVLAAAYGGIHVYNQKQEEKEASEEEAEKLTVVDFKTDDVTAFSYVLGGDLGGRVLGLAAAHSVGLQDDDGQAVLLADPV